MSIHQISIIIIFLFYFFSFFYFFPFDIHQQTYNVGEKKLYEKAPRQLQLKKPNKRKSTTLSPALLQVFGAERTVQ